MFLEIYGLPRIIMAIDLNHNNSPRSIFAKSTQEVQRWIDQQERQREMLAADWQWYFAAGDTKSKRRTKKDVYQVTAVWADVDPPPHAKPDTAPSQWESWKQAFSPTIFRTEPTFVIDSGSGFQPFWRFDRPIEPGLAEGIMKTIARVHETDSSVADAARIMRLPGTRNTKKGVDLIANFSHYDGYLYHPGELLEVYPEETLIPEEPVITVEPDRITTTTVGVGMEYGLATRDLIQRIDKLARTQSGDPTPRHKQALGIMAMCAGQEGVTDGQIESCGRAVRSALNASGYTNKYGEGDVERLIHDAIAFGRDHPLRPLSVQQRSSPKSERTVQPANKLGAISRAPTPPSQTLKPFVL